MYESSSSDSGDRCERFRNVRSLLVKSREGQRDLEENYAYKRRLGDLIFNANFEGANLGHVEQVDVYQYDLMVRPDVGNPRHRIWFNFRVSNQRPNQCVVFTLVNLSESLTLFSEGLTPVVRCQSRPDWVRLSGSQVFHYRSSSHNNRRVLSIAFRFAAHDDEHQFALFYPYTITTLTDFIDRWHVQLKRRGGGESGLTIEILTTSLLSKPIYMFQTRPPANVKLSAIISVRKSGNFESAASWVAQGLMDFMLSDHPIAYAARDHIHLTIFPMLDPDSRWVGNSRTDLMGQSSVDSKLMSANPHIYETHRMVEHYIESITSKAQGQVVIVELRVGANLIGSRFVGSTFSDSLRMERHLHLPRLMSRFCSSFYLEKCEFTGETTVPANSCHNQQLDKYQFEVSPFGCYKRTLLNAECQPYEQRDYLLLGKALAYSLLEHSRATRQDLPDETVSETLASFRHKPADVDDLVLVQVDEAP